MKFLWHKFDPSSLKVRLTLGIAIASVCSLGGLAIWTGMRMQQILIATHKDDIKYIAERFADHVEIYSDMVSLEEGTQRALDNLSGKNKVLWVKTDAGEVTAKSLVLQDKAIADILFPLNNIPPIPHVQDLQGRYWLLCASPLEIDNNNLGKLYIGQDITDDQVMLLSLMRSLSIATLIAISMMTGVIAIYVDRSIRPLKRISQITSNISAEKLSEAQVHLDNAPREVKELAETFDEMLTRLSESWEHQRQLLSNVSHELRTPLTIISGYLQSTLRRGNNLTEIQREALTTASSEADRTVQLLRDLLDLARVDSGGMHFQLEPIMVNDMVKEIIEMAGQYSDRIIQLETSPNPLVIEVDINRFKQIMLNLIDNAVKYSLAPNPITLKIKQHENKTQILVCDKGSGIPLTQQGRIFERFYRLDEARNRAGGTGLGLSIVKTLVEGMSGNISVRSQLGEGTTFTVCFPLERTIK
ncbi:MAG: HAMP domain-containing sensor histidine kinase [Xenococcaceae cyanobacterium MO_188.B19]|nr:HAMP domain-containing sensor histidine kinase [Xenococcaceae cyanobacterium MO_188.B19]